ncbi:gliding motility-associated C-terminal domain-containing protein [Flavobacteriaceae bacterium GSB9]|nr:gliding motility-associated C-terminal domain-containing protein [Flavobacteriaceae bacterium GSB9]
MKNFTIVTFVFLLFFSFVEKLHTQIVIAKPSLGFTQACASPSFNTYNVTFSFSPDTALESSNQFIVELSDETGDFSNPTTVFTSNAGSITTSPATINFAVPTTISGEGYKIKIRSTAPAASSSPSNQFAAYYKIQDTPFTINNLIATGAYCSGGSYLLTIDNPGDENNDSPLQYPSLTFKWFKETGSTTSVFVADGPSLSVNEPGTYFVETNYGTCTSNSFSNRVTISEATTQSTFEINSSKGNPFCSAEGPSVLSAVNGNSYQWYKDGGAIEGATQQMYEASESGNYSVTVDLGDCSTSASIDLDSTGFSSSIDVEDVEMIDENETLTATVTTDAKNPEFKWYLNDNLIASATTNNFQITQTGNYRVEINQTADCLASTEFSFVVQEAFPDVPEIPNLISPNGDGVNDTWVIPQQYVDGSNTEITILSSQGKVVLKTNNYQNNWPQNQINFIDVNPVYYYIIKPAGGSEKKGSITVVK